MLTTGYCVDFKTINIIQFECVKEFIRNIFKKIYCRIYQGVFRLVLPFLPYREPKILNSLNEIPDLLEKLNKKSAMLVTDSGIRGFGITKPLEELLEKRKIKLVVYDKTRPNPTVTFTLPPHLTSTTGMDALTHAVEAYIGRSTTRETRKKAISK